MTNSLGVFVASTKEAPECAGESLYFAFRGDELVLTAGGQILTELGDITHERRHYIGTVNGVHGFSVLLSGRSVLGEGLRSEGLRAAAGLLDPGVWLAAAYASQIAQWDRTHRHCGACGGATEKLVGERAMVCQGCGERYYPRISPCTITLVHSNRRVLLTRQSKWPAGRYGLVAGFVEPGESLEECARREVFEETGVGVSEPVYMGSQPWPFPGQMMVGFRAEYAGGEVVPCAVELEDARWFEIDRLPILPPRFSIARRLIDDYVMEVLARGP